MAAKASWHCHRMYCFTLLVCVARTTPTRPIATRSARSVWAGRELKNIANINKRPEKKSKTCDMPRVRRDHPRCRRATWFGVCGHARDFIARLGFHRNPFRRFGDIRSRNLPIPITLASAWLLAFTVYKPLFFSRNRLKLNSTTRTRTQTRHGPDMDPTGPASTRTDFFAAKLRWVRAGPVGSVQWNLAITKLSRLGTCRPKVTLFKRSRSEKHTHTHTQQTNRFTRTITAVSQ